MYARQCALQRVALGRATAQSGRAGGVGGGWGWVYAAAPAACCTTLTRMPRPEITGDHRRGGERRFDGSKAQRSPSLAQRSLLGTAHQMEGRRLEGTHATVTVACKPTNVAQCEWPIE